MKKLKSIKSLKKQAWKLMSEYVRRRDRGVCFTCGDQRPWKGQQAGHFVHKDCLDFDFRNINCQCVRCNKWLHGNLTVYAERLIQTCGPGIVHKLVRKGLEVKKFSREELASIIYGLQNRIKTLGNVVSGKEVEE